LNLLKISAITKNRATMWQNTTVIQAMWKSVSQSKAKKVQNSRKLPLSQTDMNVKSAQNMEILLAAAALIFA